MPDFQLVAPFQPTGDQPRAIERLSSGLARGLKDQVLMGATGTGKSLASDEPVLIGRQDDYGAVSWSVEPIGPLVDRVMEEGRRWVDDHGTEVVFARGLPSGYVVATVDPSTHASVVRPVTAFSRHRTPPEMWRVTTTDGRSVVVTGDHNFVRLGDDQRLQAVPTRDLKPGDALPIPVATPGPEDPRARLDVAADLVGSSLYVTSPPAGGPRQPLRQVGLAGIATLERSGETRVTGRIGHRYLLASMPMERDLLAFLGMFVAEGHVANNFATVTPGPEDLQLARDLLGSIHWLYFERGRDELGLGSKVITELLRLHCGAKAGVKHLPLFWAELGDEDLGTLLAGYFEGDGWVEANGAAVLAVTKSRRLANELAYALLRFGIVARLSTTFKRAVGTSHAGADYWQVAIRGADDIRSFARGIGFLSPRKRAQLESLCRSIEGGNADELPTGVDRLLASARLAAGISQRELARMAGLSRASIGLLETGKRGLRRGTAQILLNALEQVAGRRDVPGPVDLDDALGGLRRLLACRWATIRETKPIAPLSPHVYDFSVDGAETFLAGFGGLVVHNTYSIASVIQKHQKPTLVLAHNKTLAAQLYSEFRDFFPHNAVEYFVSYFDYYQPEAYLPRSDTYIEKDSSRNDEIDKLRHAATHALFERRDVIIVASVSCIYGLGAPVDYGATVIRLRVGGRYRRDGVLRQLVDLQYQRNDQALSRARFRVRGDTLEVQPAYDDFIVRVQFFGDEIERITELDPLTGEMLAERAELNVYPASHYVTPADKLKKAIVDIDAEMEERTAQLEAKGMVLEAARLRQRTTFDLEMMRELGFCSGIENYSRHLAGREAGSRPWTLLDYFPPDWLLVVDESHMTIPQVVGMYKNDRTRKEILVEYGFRLPSALDNRPLTFDEFQDHLNQVVYMSATPGAYELERSKQVVEQLIRPTGIVDPTVQVQPTEGQIDDLLERIRERTLRGERVLVTTLTKRMAEDLTDYLKELGVKVNYLHSEVDTLERVQILRDLRLGVYDVLVGINLLREGIDLPEVTLVAILDADKEGFLRSAWSLIQVSGRAARNTGGEVVMYADTITESMRVAIDETNRRRGIQEAFNTEHGIEPATIIKEIRDINDRLRAVADRPGSYASGEASGDLSELSREQIAQYVAQLEANMREAARNLEFERAAALRDQVQEIRLRVLEEDASVTIARAAEAAAGGATGRRSGGRRGARAGAQAPPDVTAGVVEVTAVEVLPSGEEPVEAAAPDDGTAADWLPGIRDEHDDDGGWQARWLDRPTWDRRVTPNVIKRTGTRPRRRR